MEQELLKSKVPVIIAHLPDLFGPHATNTLLHETLKGAIKGKKKQIILGEQISCVSFYILAMVQSK